MTRIIAGSLKNRTIATPKHLTVRPTQDRVKATIFNVLGDVENLKVIDLFAGSGSLGFEALSRGAALVYFVEKDPALVASLSENARHLGVTEQVEIVQEDALRFVEHLPTVDLILADPPYAYPYKNELVARILSGSQAALMLETDKFYQLPADLKETLSKTKQSGDTILYFFRL